MKHSIVIKSNHTSPNICICGHDKINFMRSSVPEKKLAASAQVKMKARFLIQKIHMAKFSYYENLEKN